MRLSRLARRAAGLAAGAVVVGMCAGAHANPVTVNFSQIFDGGGVVSGSFTGDDADSNGQLSSFAGEISAFSMSFSGNSDVAAFAVGVASLGGLVYDVGTPLIGDGAGGDVEGIAAAEGVFSYLAGLGPLGSTGGVVSGPTGSSATGDIATVAAAPAPGLAGLLGIGLAAMGFVRRRRS